MQSCTSNARFPALLTLVVFTAFFWIVPTSRAQDEFRHRPGIGMRYRRPLQGTESELLSRDGTSWILGYQFAWHHLFRADAALELIPWNFAGEKPIIVAPQVSFLVGAGLYGGVGLGVFLSADGVVDRPFLTFRAGFEPEFQPALILDLGVDYRTITWTEEVPFSTTEPLDNLSLSATLRYEFF